MNNEVITSRNNPIVKLAASLADKKGRRAARAFMVEGVKLSVEAIKEGLPITHILVNAADKDVILPHLTAELKAAGISDADIYLLGEGAFEKISTEKAPQGVITIIKYLDFSINADIIYKEEFFLDAQERALVLCSVRDPLNLGAIIRSAVAFGIERVVLSDDCADVYSPKALRSSMGGIFKTKITVVSDLCRFVLNARKASRRVFAAELTERAVSLKEVGLCGTDIVIIGNEGHGIPESVSALCDASVYIPITGGVESLNASVAASVFMWEQSKF